MPVLLPRLPAVTCIPACRLEMGQGTCTTQRTSTPIRAAIQGLAGVGLPHWRAGTWVLQNQGRPAFVVQMRSARGCCEAMENCSTSIGLKRRRTAAAAACCAMQVRSTRALLFCWGLCSNSNVRVSEQGIRRGWRALFQSALRFQCACARGGMKRGWHTRFETLPPPRSGTHLGQRHGVHPARGLCLQLGSVVCQAGQSSHAFTDHLRDHCGAVRPVDGRQRRRGAVRATAPAGPAAPLAAAGHARPGGRRINDLLLCRARQVRCCERARCCRECGTVCCI